MSLQPANENQSPKFIVEQAERNLCHPARMPTSATTSQPASIIQQNGIRLIEIVNNILDISKIQTGQVKIEKRSTMLKFILYELVTMFSPFAKIKNIC